MRFLERIMMAIFVFGALAAIGDYFYYQDRNQLRKKTMLIVTDCVREIVNGWNPENYKKYVVVVPGTEPMIAAAFKGYARLGDVVVQPVCAIKDFTSEKDYHGTGQKYVEAAYTCGATFKNGPATVQISVYRMGDDFWRIRTFNVESPFFFTAQQAR